MRPSLRVPLFLIVLAALAACDSTPPDTGTQVSGMVTELGEIPNPPMDVKVRFWHTGDPSPHDAADLLTEGSGAFVANLANIEPRILDSIRVTATRYDCEGNRATGATVRRGDIAGAHTVTMPRINLNFELTRPSIGQGIAVCAAIPHRTATLEIDDMARLSIWIDDISDSVRGRWSASHSAPISADGGNFTGDETVDGAVTTLHLHLRPSETSSCPGLDLVIPTLNDGSAEMGVAMLSGGSGCALTDGPVRFFKGASLLPVEARLAS